KGKNREGLPYHLIEQNVTSDNAPLNNLHIFLFNCYGTGRDAFAPYLKRNKYGKIEFTGLGIFQYDRMKLVLDAKETLLLKMMKGRGKGGILPVQINAGSEEHVAALSLLKEEPSMHFALDHGEALKMTIDLHLIGMLKEIPRMNMRSEITYKY